MMTQISDYIWQLYEESAEAGLGVHDASEVFEYRRQLHWLDELDALGPLADVDSLRELVRRLPETRWRQRVSDYMRGYLDMLESLTPPAPTH